MNEIKMKCERCKSENVKEKTLGSFEDLHNIVKVFVCLDCKFEKTININIQEGIYAE